MAPEDLKGQIEKALILLNQIHETIVGNLSGKQGLITEVADIKARVTELEAAAEKAGDRTWDVALGIVKSAASAAIGAAAAILATKGAPH